MAKIFYYRPDFGANISQPQLYQGLQGTNSKNVVANNFVNTPNKP
jgi:hypothetical protein